MRPIQTLSFLLSLHGVAVQHVAARFASSILYPNASSIWYRDYTHNVTWDTSALPAGAISPIIRLFKNGEDTAQILASDFDLRRGRVEVHVPWVVNGSDYQIRMSFDSSASTGSSTVNSGAGPTNTSLTSTDCGMMTSANTSSTVSTDPIQTPTSTSPPTTDASAPATVNSTISEAAASSTSVLTSTSSALIQRANFAADNSTTVASSTDNPSATITSTTLFTATLLSDTNKPTNTISPTATGSSTTAVMSESDCTSNTTATSTATTATSTETTGSTAGSEINTITTTTVTVTAAASAVAPSPSGNFTSSSDDPVAFFISATFTIVERPDSLSTTGNGEAVNGTSSTPPQGMLMGRRWRYKRALVH